MSESSDGKEMLRKFAQALLSLPPEGARVPVDPAARKLFAPRGPTPEQSEVPFIKDVDKNPSRSVQVGDVSENVSSPKAR